MDPGADSLYCMGTQSSIPAALGALWSKGEGLLARFPANTEQDERGEECGAGGKPPRRCLAGFSPNRRAPDGLALPTCCAQPFLQHSCVGLPLGYQCH